MKKIVVADADTVIVVTGNVPATILMDHSSASLRVVYGQFLEPTKLLTLNIFRYTPTGWSVDVIKPQDDPHDLMCSAWINGEPVMGQRVPTSARLVAVHTVEKESP
jgi:hypothetical protein